MSEELVTAAELIEQAAVATREDFKPDRERSLVLTKLDEAALWLSRCTEQPPP